MKTIPQSRRWGWGGCRGRVGASPGCSSGRTPGGSRWTASRTCTPGQGSIYKRDDVFLTFCEKLIVLEVSFCKVNIFKDYITELYLKGHGNEVYFPRFCINRFGRSLTLHVELFRFWLRISPRIRSQNRNGSKGSVRDSWRSDLCKTPENSPHCHVPLNMKYT